jgi:hypothetical protein
MSRPSSRKIYGTVLITTPTAINNKTCLSKYPNLKPLTTWSRIPNHEKQLKELHN